ncbi:hypothetical protein A9A71_121455 [Stutzerimonas stutzeri]|nr:hypothetical protein A9A71_121455 [Stutzerimonas stutzeri]
MDIDPENRRFFWTKVWGVPGRREVDALQISFERVRDEILSIVKPGDIVVYLASDNENADADFRGCVIGAVEIEGNPVTTEELGIVAKAEPKHFNKAGEYRWPYAITVRRVWRAIDKIRNDKLVPDHKAVGIQGAKTIHPMTRTEMQDLMKLNMIEVGHDVEQVPERFGSSLRRPWHQKQGKREGTEVNPGSELYLAMIYDDHGMTFKVGSGIPEERLADLNRYRRASQKEMFWSIMVRQDFSTVERARAAEDYMVRRIHEAGWGSPDHSEFAVGVSLHRMRNLFAEAVDIVAAGNVTASISNG